MGAKPPVKKLGKRWKLLLGDIFSYSL